MEFRILGPLEVADGDRLLPLGGGRPRALLAILLLRAPEVVSSDRLIDDLWGEGAPAGAAHTLQVHVSNLRKLLEGSGGAARRLVTRPPGYVLQFAPDELDLTRFERLAAVGREALADGDAARAADALRDALALWRGPALADLAYEAFALGPVSRMEELRIATLEDRVEANLACARHAALVGELEALIAAHPLRERLRRQHMLALYRAGRQAEALEAFQAARRALVEELGIEPGRDLARLERSILQQDTALELPAARAPGASPSPPPLVPIAQRSILLAPDDDAGLASLVALAEPLATSQAPHELILARIVEAGGQLGVATALLNGTRAYLAGKGVSARAAAFTSPEPARDLVRLASEQDVDLMLLHGSATPGEGPFTGASAFVLADAPCDVALVHARGGVAADGPVLVPFGGGEHDWAAVELGAWLASALAAPLRLLGSTGSEGGRDASRLLAHAALAVQQLTGVVTESVIYEPGDAGLLAAVEEAGLVVAGLADAWRSDGLAGARLALARDAVPPVLLVRRGLRPGGLAPRDSFTRFTWSLSGPVRQ